MTNSYIFYKLIKEWGISFKILETTHYDQLRCLINEQEIVFSPSPGKDKWEILTDYIIEKHLTKDFKEEPKLSSFSDFIERELNRIDSEILQKIDGYKKEPIGDIFSHPMFNFTNISYKLRYDLKGFSLSDTELVKV